jgi:hypothetical protein
MLSRHSDSPDRATKERRLYLRGGCSREEAVAERRLWQRGGCSKRRLWQRGGCSREEAVAERRLWQRGGCSREEAVAERRLFLRRKPRAAGICQCLHDTAQTLEFHLLRHSKAEREREHLKAHSGLTCGTPWKSLQ